MPASTQRRTDRVLDKIAEYVTQHKISRKPAYEMARYCLLDSLACGLEAQAHPDCARLLGPVVPGATLANGARLPGTRYRLEPVKAAFDISTAIRWLEYSDTWFGTDGGHPSDCLGAVLAVADYMSRKGDRAFTVGDVLTALIKVYEIHGVLLIKNNFIDLGLDGIGVVAVASAAIATQMLGGSYDQVVNAMSNAWLDGASPRLYRIGHNAGPRKAWAAGDAASRGVMHALFALRGEPGYPAALTTPKWGVSDAVLHGNPIVLGRALDSHIVENVFFIRKRSNTNAMRIEFRDGSMTPEVRIDYPVGHPRRRPEALPLVEAKFRRSVEHFLPRKRQAAVLKACGDLARLRRFAFDDFMDLFAA